MKDDLFLILFEDNGQILLGVQSGDKTYAIDDKEVESLDWLLSNEELALGNVLQTVRENILEPLDLPASAILAPISEQEIWAAGVTYKRSEEARERESNNSNIYTRVYNSQRPELFVKGFGWDTVGSGDNVGIRYDAKWSVPEPELVVVINSRMQIVGFTIGNDMSSRDIEGENPLYLPQAKVYERSCAIGPRIWLQPGATAWPDLAIRIAINRDGKVAFEGETSTKNLNRTLADLVDYLGRCKPFPNGVFLFSGTGIVPPDSFTLAAGDEVRIKIDPIGELVNKVIVVGGKK